MARPASAGRKTIAWAHRNPWAVVGIASAVALAFLGLAYGLWERIQYLQWKSNPIVMQQGIFFGPPEGEKTLAWAPIGELPAFMLAYFFFGAAMFYALSIRSRRVRNLPVSRIQTVILAACGFALIVMAILAELVLIRLQIWLHYFNWHTLIGLAFGAPVLFCWCGGVWIWQAFDMARGAQTETARNTEWLPLQARRHHSGAFLLAAMLNLAFSIVIARLTTPLWYGDMRSDGVVIPEEAFFGQISFAFIAFSTAVVGWVFARRKVNETSRPMLVILATLYAGSFLVWLNIPSPTFLTLAVVTGLAGVFLFLKMIRVRAANSQSSEPRLSEVFTFDRSGLIKGLMFWLIAYLMAFMVVSFWRSDFPFLFYVFGLNSSFIPAATLGMRHTSGGTRELFCTLFGAWCGTITSAILLAYVFGMRFGEAASLFLIPSAFAILTGTYVLRLGKVRVNQEFWDSSAIRKAPPIFQQPAQS
jgi:hypothetical protein